MKDKNSAAVLALVLGGIGGHKFYLGQTGMGVVYLMFAWTFIPMFVSFIEAFMLLGMSPEVFNARFNPGVAMPLLAPPQPQNIVVNVTNTAGAGAGATSGENVAERIKALHELKVAGALTEDEFTNEKRKLLGSGS